MAAARKRALALNAARKLLPGTRWRACKSFDRRRGISRERGSFAAARTHPARRGAAVGCTPRRVEHGPSGERVLAVEYSVADGSITRNSLAHRGVANATL